MIVFHLTCVMPIPAKTFQTSYILAINNKKQTVKSQIQQEAQLSQMPRVVEYFG